LVLVDPLNLASLAAMTVAQLIAAQARAQALAQPYATPLAATAQIAHSIKPNLVLKFKK
jgi:hypothetical protein